MRLSAVITTVIHVGLGITGGGCRFDTPPVDAGVGGGDGGGGDSAQPEVDRLVIDRADVRLAQSQRVRIRVTKMLANGTMQDVTASATFESDNAAVATSVGPGQIDGGTQAGIATITARLGTAQPGTMKVMVTSKTCRPVINEFQTGGISAADEWVEILNPCTMSIDVSSWTLVYRSQSATTGSDSATMIGLTGTLTPGALRLYAGVDYGGVSDGQWPVSTGYMAQTSGAIALRMGPVSTGPIADSVAYGVVALAHPFIEAAATSAGAVGQSMQRQPFDGRDDDDNSMDFKLATTPSPRAANAP